MFVQVIRGRAVDPAQLRSEWDRCQQALRADVDGWLGSTAGVADDSTFVAMVRFASEPAPVPVWREVLGLLDDAVVEATGRTDVWNRGGADDAGFVQVRQGVTDDPARLRELYVEQQPVRMGPFRPEVLGGLFAWHDGGRFTLSAYFTSEEAARRGEALHEFRSFFDDIDAVMQDLTYLDLHDPWLWSAGQAIRSGASSDS